MSRKTTIKSTSTSQADGTIAPAATGNPECLLYGVIRNRFPWE
jgi:hypothetical protein